MDPGRLPCVSIQISQIHLFTRFRAILAWANGPAPGLLRSDRTQELPTILTEPFRRNPHGFPRKNLQIGNLQNKDISWASGRMLRYGTNDLRDHQKQPKDRCRNLRQGAQALRKIKRQGHTQTSPLCQDTENREQSGGTYDGGIE